jgi:hypothetical protein
MIQLVRISWGYHGIYVTKPTIYHCTSTIRHQTRAGKGTSRFVLDAGKVGSLSTISTTRKHESLVGGLEPWNFMTFIIYGIILPID